MTTKKQNKGVNMDIQFVSRKVVMDSILDKMNRKETLTQDEKDFLRSMSEKQKGK